MTKPLALLTLAATAFAATADAGPRRHLPADATSYYATVEQQPAPPVRTAPVTPREDFGSFSAGNVARTFGY